MLAFEIIGADSENYFLMAFDRGLDMDKGVFFYKMPVSYFFEYGVEGETVIEFLIRIEDFVGSFYENLIRDGVLTVIDEVDFDNIIINYGDGLNEIID